MTSDRNCIPPPAYRWHRALLVVAVLTVLALGSWELTAQLQPGKPLREVVTHALTLDPLAPLSAVFAPDS